MNIQHIIFWVSFVYVCFYAGWRLDDYLHEPMQRIVRKIFKEEEDETI